MSDMEAFSAGESDSNSSLLRRTTGMALDNVDIDNTQQEDGGGGVPAPEEERLNSPQSRFLVIVDGTFFEILTDKSTGDNIVAVCKKCEPDVVEVKGHRLSSSNFVSHLKRKHGNEAFTEYREYLTKN